MEDLEEWLSLHHYEAKREENGEKIYCNNKSVVVIDNNGLKSLTAMEDLSMEDMKKLNIK